LNSNSNASKSFSSNSSSNSKFFNRNRNSNSNFCFRFSDNEGSGSSRTHSTPETSPEIFLTPLEIQRDLEILDALKLKVDQKKEELDTGPKEFRKKLEDSFAAMRRFFSGE